VALSRRAAHALSRAPSDLLPRAALRWAQIAGFGVRADVARALLQYRLELEQEPFWRMFLEKLAAAKELRLDRIGPLVDYLRHRRREAKDYTLNGQSIDSMLRAVERWHAELRRNQRQPAFTVPPAQARWEPLPEIEPRTETFDVETWDVREILTFEELFDEGRRMHHCVASYARACHARSMSIWSLRVRDAQRELARVTIRMDVAARKIVEARRFANAFVTTEQLRFIRRWADLNRIEVGKLTA
jgi:hypothetical protein